MKTPEGILFQNSLFTVWLSGSDLTFEYCKTGDSFTLYCELLFDPHTEMLTNVVVTDYDGCYDFDRDEVIQTLEAYYSEIEIDFSEL